MAIEDIQQRGENRNECRGGGSHPFCGKSTLMKLRNRAGATEREQYSCSADSR